MALDHSTVHYPMAEVKIEPEECEEQVYYEHSDWENSYAEGTVVSDNHETAEIYVDESSYMYHDSQMEYETVIMPAYQIRTHTGKRPYVCESCNTTVMPNNRPWNHIRILGGGQPIVRHVYYMNFTRKSVCSPTKPQSDKPRKGGKGKRTYPCDKCERVFGHKSHLDNHLRTHSGEKPFICVYCDKRFGQKSNLTSHMRRHPVDGNSCPKRFKGLPNIKEEPRNEVYEIDSSVDIAKTTPLSQVPQDEKKLSEMVQSEDLSQEIQSSTESISTKEVLVKDESPEKLLSLDHGEEKSSNVTLHGVESCIVAATEEVKSQPHSQKIISSLTVPKKEVLSPVKLCNTSSPSLVKKEISQASSLEVNSSPAILKVLCQGKTKNVISSSTSPKKVLFQIRSQLSSSSARHRQTLSQRVSQDVSSSILDNQKKIPAHEKSSVVSEDSGSSQNKLCKLKSTSQDKKTDKEQKTKTSTSEIVPVMQMKTDKLETVQEDHKLHPRKGEKL
ncbi:uncharacterized protein [Palaemon carinicauda]|uniref:uncharacterized protein n=1 Tax=Palaemon carinicauda TaxID=392227 RepID=UPI0035B629CB